MEVHADVAAAVAGEIRAIMGRRNLSRADLATALGVTAHTAGRKFSGEAEYTLTELVVVSHWLGVQLDALIASATAEAVSA